MKGKTYLVLGATGGIGSALCRSLASRGANLFVAARGEERLGELAEELGATACPTDATNPDEVRSCFEKIAEADEPLDGVVHCVGSILLKSAHLTSDEEWQQTMASNLDSAFYVVREATRAMLRTGGSIVLMSSCAARSGIPNHEAIAAAKAGVIGLTLATAASYASRGIRVNCVAPGLVETPLTESITKNERSLEASRSMHPLDRIGNPDDIVSAIGWFLDPKNSWVTGQVLGVDGGLASVRSLDRR